MTLTIGSLFSGIGGLDLGLERAGMEVKWQVENDEYCQRVLAKHWPNVKRYGDVRDCGSDNLEHVDLICGGFPCQPVSCAGQRKGTDDERWLWPEFARIIRELRPRWVLAENVPGLLSIDAGRIFGTVLRDLAACGYDAEWDCIPAAAVGAPHRRDRVFILAHAASRQSGERGRKFGRNAIDKRSEVVADANGKGCADIQGQCATAGTHGSIFAGTDHRKPEGIWSLEPDVGRVADGVPKRVDRLRGLGNAVVPQVAEWIGRRIVDSEGV